MPNYLPIGIIGTGKRAVHRAEWVQAIPNVHLKGIFDLDWAMCQTTARRFNTIPFEHLDDLLKQIAVLVIATPAAEHFEVAQKALRQGVPVFLDGRPTASIRECEILLKTAEEADAEVGISAPLRFHPVLKCLPDVPKLLTLNMDFTPSEPSVRSWHYELSHVLHLSHALSQADEVKRIEVTAVRDDKRMLQALALGLRFQNGIYAQIRLRHWAHLAESAQKLYAVTGEFHLEADLRRNEFVCSPDFKKQFLPKTNLHIEEMAAFFQAIRDRQTAPVSLIHGLNMLQLTERIMQRLR